MNLKEKFNCRKCNEIFKSPVFLGCCGENICKEHIDKIMLDGEPSKTCPFCFKDISKQIFHVNKTIEDLIEMEIDKFNIDPEYASMINQFKEEFERYKYVLNNPEIIIKNYFDELKRQVDLDRETIKSLVDKRANKIIEELSLYEKTYISEYKFRIDLNYYDLLKNGFDTELNKYNKYLKSFDNEKWKRLSDDIIEKIEYLKLEINEIELKLLANKSVTYEQMKANIDDYFGILINKEIENTAIIQKSKIENYYLISEIITGDMGGVCALKLFQNGNLASGSDSGIIKIWDINQCRTVLEIKENKNGIWALELVHSGDLASAGSDNAINIWNTKDGSLKMKLMGHKGFILALKSLKNTHLASGSDDDTIKIWNIYNGTLIRTLEGHNNCVRSITTSENGYLISGSWDCRINVWNLKDGILIRTLPGHGDYVSALLLLEDGCLASGGYDNKIKMWNFNNGKLIKILEGHKKTVQALVELKYKFLASASWDNTIKIWNTYDGTLIKTLAEHTSEVRALVLFKNGYLISGSDDGTIKIWANDLK